MEVSRCLLSCLALLVGCSLTTFLLFAASGTDMRVSYTPVRAAQLFGLDGPTPERSGGLDVTALSRCNFSAEVVSMPEGILRSAQGREPNLRGDEMAPFLGKLTSTFSRVEAFLSSSHVLASAPQPGLNIPTDPSTRHYRVPHDKQQYMVRWSLLRDVPPASVLPWRPRPGKYMLAQCTYGRMSNKRRCFQNSLVAAAATGRTLVIPTWSNRMWDDFYRFDLVLNASFMRTCLGVDAVATEAEYRSAIGAGESDVLVVDRYQCILTRDVHCPKPRAAEKLFERTPLKLPDRSWLNRTGTPVEMALLASVAGDETLISMGDLYSVSFRFNDSFFPPTPYGPFNMTCHMLMRPHNAIVDAARGFVETFIGEQYMAVHLRRGDFLRAHPDLFHGILHVARCISEGISPGSNISTIFLATDATNMEIDLLRWRLENPVTGPPLSIVRFPQLAGNSEWVWAREWNKLNLDEDRALAVPTAEKLVAALSAVFRGNGASTFTEDIWTMRVALGLASELDADVCFHRAHRMAPAIDK